MFLSAGMCLKLHSWPYEPTSNVPYKPLGLGNVLALSLSRDNGFVTFVTDTGDPEIISLKDFGNIKNVHTITAVADVCAVAFGKTTKRCIGIATHAGQVALYDTKNKVINKLLQTAPSSVNLLDFSVADTQMAVSCLNGSILLYDVKHGNVCESYVASWTLTPTALTYHPIENHILGIGIADGTILQWDTNAGLTRFSAQVHTAAVTGLVLMQSSNLTVSVGSDHKLCIHDVNGECIFRSNQQHPLTAVDVSNDGLNVAIGSDTGYVSVYDMRKLIKPLLTIRAHNSAVNKIKFEHAVKHHQAEPSEDFIGSRRNQESVIENDWDKRGKESTEPFESEREIATSPELAKAEVITMKSIKQEIATTINKATLDLKKQLMAQFESLQEFVMNEFRTIETQMNEKWDLITIIRASCKDINKDFLER